MASCKVDLFAKGSSSKLVFLPTFESDSQNFQLLELNNDALNHLKTGPLYIKGKPDAEAVLCTDDKTFLVRKAETSNSLLLVATDEPVRAVDESDSNKENALCTFGVGGIAMSHLELIETVPQLTQLRELLSDSMYKGSEYEPAVRHKKTFEELLTQVQASRKQIEQGLHQLHTFELNGYVRMMDQRYAGEVVELILSASIENDWAIAALKPAEVSAVLSRTQMLEYPVQVVRACLSQYGTIVDGENDIFALEEQKLCVFFAEQALLIKPEYRFDEFMQVWRRMCKDLIEPQLSMLRGVALVYSSGVEQFVKSFLVSSLPQNPRERFAQIFAARQKWTLEDLQPYIMDIIPPNMTAAQFLLKHTRTSVSKISNQDVVLYGARL
eukprot:GILK01007582.1.p1 GENE.GILK01007582.1~~GILK01007582.1.p1  ORF type:complete len:397 (+),score=66.09 GILK01007582.1:45-1193(+)